MKREFKGFIFKIAFIGDSITPVYRIRMYEPRKWWFNKFLHEESIYRDTRKFPDIESTLRYTIGQYYLYKGWRF